MADATFPEHSSLRRHSRTGIKALAIGLLVGLLSACASSAPTSSSSSAADTTVAGESAGNDAEYRISPEDVIDISVWKEPDLQRQVTVRPDGGISFPLIGNINAAGKTAPELQTTITQGIAEYIPDAVVTVSVVQVKGLKVFVTGQVKKPGQYLIGRYVDVLQAITLAGGLTAFADRRNVRILRRSDSGEQVFNFDYNQVQKGQGLDQNILLRSGDTVLVP